MIAVPSRAIAALFAAVMMVACSQQAKPSGPDNSQAPKVAEVPTFKVASDAAYPPFESQINGQNITGFDVDILNAAAKKGGFKVEFFNTPWEGIFATLGTGERDIVASAISITEARKQTLDFSLPYFEAKQLIAVSNMSKLTQISELRGKRVGVQSGTTGDAIAQDSLGKSNTNIVRFESTPLALKELQEGKLDAVVADNGVAINFIKSNPSSQIKLIDDPDFSQEYYAFAVKKGNTVVLERVNAGIKAIKADGTYQQIYAHYFGTSGQ